MSIQSGEVWGKVIVKVCMPYHKLLDCLEEDRLAGKKFGSTRRGIAPVYADKYMKKTLRMEDLLELEKLEERVGDIAEWKNLTVSGGYGLDGLVAVAPGHGQVLQIGRASCRERV